MRQLRLVGLAEDGDSLLLESPTGESYRLPVDERVRAACRGDLTRLGQIEIETDNPLRPREIQTRVRAGESAQQIAATSGMPVDRVLRFAYPVLQERSRVIAQARLTAVRPPAPELLGDLVEERLVSRGTDAATLEWDAWRREDGRWAVRLAWRHGEREHAASWSLDLARRALQAEDPAAEQLSAKEFHARTITPVTPLAVAARAADGRPAGPQALPPVRDAGPGRLEPRRSEPSRAEPRRPDDAPSEAGDRPTAEQIRAGGPRPDRVRRREAAPDRQPADPRPTSARSREADSRADSRADTRTDSRGGSRTDARRDARDSRSARSVRRPDTRATDADAAEPADEDGGEPAEPRRIAAGGGTVPLVDTPESEDDRARRATVPSWDDILLGVRRRH